MSAAYVLLAFLLLPPVLQLLALHIALRRGASKPTLLLVSFVLAGALVGAGVLLDVRGVSSSGESTLPVADWVIGALLGLAIVLETVIVLALDPYGHVSDERRPR